MKEIITRWKVSNCISFSPSQVYTKTSNILAPTEEAPDTPSPKAHASASPNVHRVLVFLEMPENCLYVGSKAYSGEMELTYIVPDVDGAKGLKLFVPNEFITKHFPKLNVGPGGETELKFPEMPECLEAPDSTWVRVRNF